MKKLLIILMIHFIPTTITAQCDENQFEIICSTKLRTLKETSKYLGSLQISGKNAELSK